jgi:hypothetical protein
MARDRAEEAEADDDGTGPPRPSLLHPGRIDNRRRNLSPLFHSPGARAHGELERGTRLYAPDLADIARTLLAAHAPGLPIARFLGLSESAVSAVLCARRAQSS